MRVMYFVEAAQQCLEICFIFLHADIINRVTDSQAK